MSKLVTVSHVVDKLFCSGDESMYGPYRRQQSESGHELLRDTLFRFNIESPSNERLSLQIFQGIGGIGGLLWEQEVRALQRISTRQHPALPQIRDGGFNETDNIGFIVTEAASDTLLSDDAMQYIRERPHFGLRQLVLLADALSHMHSNGLLHRNLWPGAIEILEDTQSAAGQGVRLRLSRFEMSTLLTNLLRRRSQGQIDQPIREFFIDQGLAALICAPPERLNFLFDVPGRDSVEDGRSDVFSLGVIAYQWFVGALPAEEIAASFRNGRLDSAALSTTYRQMSRGLAGAKLPKVLRDLLKEMMSEDNRSRPTAAQVIRRISQQYESLVSYWDEENSNRVFLLSYIPGEMVRTIYEWGWISQSPLTQEGQLQLQDFIQTDLRGGMLVFCEQGFTMFGSRDDPRKQEARYVLLGRTGAYFATLYQHKKGWNRGGQDVEQVLIIKYIIERTRVGRIERNPLQRRLPDIKLLPMGSPQLDPGNAVHSPSWKAILRSVEQRLTAPIWHQDLEDALQWFLDLQQVEVDARQYAYVAEKIGGEYAELRLDPKRDRERISKKPFLSLFAKDIDRRPDFGDFFEEIVSVQEEDGGDLPMLACRPDDGGKPNNDRASSSRVRFMERLDPQRIRVRWFGEPPEIPAQGWVFPLDDEATDAVLRRQRVAYNELLDLPTLVDQLHQPTATVRLRKEYQNAGQGLRGDGPQIVQQMLECWPFFALHGPPGTGKTAVTAYAVEAALQENRSLRILIAAQSHYALDNLAERIVKRLREKNMTETPLVRVASSEARERVNPSVRPLFLENQAEEMVKRIELQLDKQQKNGTHQPALAQALGRWRSKVRSDRLELMDRLRRGANIVFVTCGAATPQQVDAVGSFGVFDWVIVEEAAKAWPTELAMPLVRGARWTLIGDHRQLPAYRRREVEEMLRECATSNDEPLRQHAERREDYVKVFDLFAQIFVGREQHASSQTPRLLRDPRGELRLQFRMREPIAEVVSQAFYDGDLRTDPSTEKDHGLKTPAFIKGQALVWLDTSELPDALDRPCWQNQREVDVVDWLLKQLRLTKPQAGELAVLSPYREQIRLLKQRLRNYEECIHTVDAFQGREANVAIVSLVRNNKEQTLRRQLGHLTSPERVNVLFSRAMRLLIIVGSIEHYERCQHDFWKTVCPTVRKNGIVISAGNAGYHAGRLARQGRR